MTSTAASIPGLVAGGPAPELKDKLQLFGQFVGDWQIAARWIHPDGTETTGDGEVHFGWILNGTAIQDVWSGHVKNPPAGLLEFTFGTTLRFYDPVIGAWKCVWIAPQGSTLQTFVARAVGNEIVLSGTSLSGNPERWVYSDITGDSFRWHSEESRDEGKSWRTTEIILAHRANSPGDQ